MWLIMPSNPIVSHLKKTRLSHYFMYIITDADLCTIQNGKEIKFDENLSVSYWVVIHAKSSESTKKALLEPQLGATLWTFRVRIETKRNMRKSTSSVLLPVTALRVRDQETTLLWSQSFDLSFWLLEKRCLQARHWRDKQENCYLHKYTLHVLRCALPVKRHFFPALS